MATEFSVTRRGSDWVLWVDPHVVVAVSDGEREFDGLRAYWLAVGFVPVPDSQDLVAPPVDDDRVWLEVGPRDATWVTRHGPDAAREKFDHREATGWAESVLRSGYAAVLVGEGVLPLTGESALAAAVQARGVLAGTVAVRRALLPTRPPAAGGAGG